MPTMSLKTSGPTMRIQNQPRSAVVQVSSTLAATYRWDDVAARYEQMLIEIATDEVVLSSI